MTFIVQPALAHSPFHSSAPFAPLAAFSLYFIFSHRRGITTTYTQTYDTTKVERRKM